MTKKTTLLFFLAFMPASAQAVEHLPPLPHSLDDSKAFILAASMKLGHAMGEMQKPDKYGAGKSAPCNSDNDCSDNEKCSSNSCVPVCSLNSCPSSEFCLNEGNHNYSCVECTSNEQCSGREICKNNACVDACVNNPCASNGQACSSQDGHSYMCYGCVSSNACDSGEMCDTATKQCTDVCPNSCPNQLCEVQNSHQAKCYGCTSDEGCQTGETCDLETNECVPQSCGNAILAMRDDVAVANTDATFIEAVASNKPVILIEKTLATKNISIASKKLVGPHYFSDIPACTALEKPVLKQARNASNLRIELKDVELSDFSIEHDAYNLPASGNIHVHNMNIESANGLQMNNGGNVKFTGTNFVKWVQLKNASLSITGKFTTNQFKITNMNYTLPSDVDFTIGTLDLWDGSTFTANAPIKTNKTGKWFQLVNYSKLILNADGNEFYIAPGGVKGFQIKGNLEVNGSTTLTNGSGNPVRPVYGSTTVNAPFIVNGPVSDLLITTAEINSTFKGNGGEAYIGRMGANGYLGNPDKISITSDTVDIKKGARLEVGGVCKMTSKDIQGETYKIPGYKELNYFINLTEPPPFFDLPCP